MTMSSRLSNWRGSQINNRRSIFSLGGTENHTVILHWRRKWFKKSETFSMPTHGTLKVNAKDQKNQAHTGTSSTSLTAQKMIKFLPFLLSAVRKWCFKYSLVGITHYLWRRRNHLV
jgi:hypothetical protein